LKANVTIWVPSSSEVKGTIVNVDFHAELEFGRVVFGQAAFERMTSSS